MNHEECGNCKFFEAHKHPPNESGNCRRYPPLDCRDQDTAHESWSYPVVEWGDWCGEHQVLDELLA